MFNVIRTRFTAEPWKIAHLLDLYKSDRLDLRPYYQRNSIWSVSNQKRLIDTIYKGHPIPNFFVRSLGGRKFEMVDGQQRSRSIVGFWNGEFQDSSHLLLTKEVKNDPRNAKSMESFLEYPLTVTLLDQSFTNSEIEEFYVLVNSSGMRLNRPELMKAEYYSTRFLKLATEVAGSPMFEQLNLFTDSSSERMNDIDFASELLALLVFGVTDKKLKVDELYANDITEPQYRELWKRTEGVLRRINKLNEITPLKSTRFKQKGDFYTLFGFVANHSDVDDAALARAYLTILKLSPHIRPSQEHCDPLMEYALNCVTQSNSKKAREARSAFFENMFLNKSRTPNEVQQAVVKYLELGNEAFHKDGDLLTLRHEAIADESA
jgi:hypothetical protein